MPKNKKPAVDSDSDSDSGPDDREPPAAKKSKESGDAKGKKEWTLEKMKKVNINEFRGRKMVDIREFYEKDGKILPGKKGISLSISQWKTLLEFADEITAAIDQ